MTRIAVILTQGFADWEYALIAGTGGPFFGMQVEFFAPQAGEVKSQGGLPAIVSRRLEEIRRLTQPSLLLLAAPSGIPTRHRTLQICSGHTTSVISRLLVSAAERLLWPELACLMRWRTLQMIWSFCNEMQRAIKGRCTSVQARQLLQMVV